METSTTEVSAKVSLPIASESQESILEEAVKVYNSESQKNSEKPEVKKEESKKVDTKTTEPVEKKELKSKAWAEAARADKERREAIAQSKAQRDTIDKTQKEVNDAIALLKSNPVEYAAKYGGSDFWDKLAKTEADNAPTPEKIAKQTADEVTKLRAELESIKQQKIKDTENEKARRSLAEYEESLDALIASDEFEIVRSLDDGRETVLKLVASHLQKTGELLSAKQAVEAVQEAVENSVKKLLTTSKFKAMLAQQAETKPKKQAKTLTNEVSQRNTETEIEEDETLDKTMERLKKTKFFTDDE